MKTDRIQPRRGNPGFALRSVFRYLVKVQSEPHIPVPFMCCRVLREKKSTSVPAFERKLDYCLSPAISQ